MCLKILVKKGWKKYFWNSSTCKAFFRKGDFYTKLQMTSCLLSTLGWAQWNLGCNSNLMMPDFPHNIRIRLARLIFLSLSLPCFSKIISAGLIWGNMVGIVEASDTATIAVLNLGYNDTNLYHLQIIASTTII